MAIELVRASDVDVPTQSESHFREHGYRHGYWDGVLAACNEIICGATQHDVRLWLFREVKEWVGKLEDGDGTVEIPPKCPRGRSYDESTLHTKSPKPRPSGSTCFVYAIGDGHGHVKIGIANDIYARLRSLQTGNASRLYLIAYLAASCRQEADKIETWCHSELREDQMCGEWFSVVDDIASQTLLECADAFGIDEQVVDVEYRVY